MQTGKSPLNYFPLQPWHASKSWICCCFIKCGLKNFVFFLLFCLCSVTSPVLPMPAVVPRPCWVSGCSSRDCTALPAPASDTSISHLHLLSFISHAVQYFILFFSRTWLQFCGIVFKIWHPKLHFWHQQKLCAQYYYPHHQPPTHGAVYFYEIFCHPNQNFHIFPGTY